MIGFIDRCPEAIGSILLLGRQSTVLHVTLTPTFEIFHRLSAPPSMYPPTILAFLIRMLLLFPFVVHLLWLTRLPRNRNGLSSGLRLNCSFPLLLGLLIIHHHLLCYGNIIHLWGNVTILALNSSFNPQKKLSALALPIGGYSGCKLF